MCFFGKDRWSSNNCLLGNWWPQLFKDNSWQRGRHQLFVPIWEDTVQTHSHAHACAPVDAYLLSYNTAGPLRAQGPPGQVVHESWSLTAVTQATASQLSPAKLTFSILKSKPRRCDFLCSCAGKLFFVSLYCTWLCHHFGGTCGRSCGSSSLQVGQILLARNPIPPLVPHTVTLD